MIVREAIDDAAIARAALRAFDKGDRYLAYEVCRAAPQIVARLKSRGVQKLARGLNDWPSTDCFGSFVGGVAWRENVVNDEVIYRWSASNDRWKRRAALVCTIPLNMSARGATSPTGDARRTLAICRRLIADRDDMVVKAMSWALRALSSVDRNAVEKFLATNSTKLASRVLREVKNKLETGLKNPARTCA